MAVGPEHRVVTEPPFARLVVEDPALAGSLENPRLGSARFQEDESAAETRCPRLLFRVPGDELSKQELPVLRIGRVLPGEARREDPG